MSKITVAVLIIGAFLVYSFVHSQSNGAALTPKSTVDPVTTATAPNATNAAAATTPQQPTPTTVATAPTATSASSGGFKDGSYTGNEADAQWGFVQVQAVVSQGKISEVRFVEYPSDRSRSRFINGIADPELVSEAIQAQSAQVDVITGATDSSEAFMQSLADALSQATS